jgi:hypothetical protein
MCFELLTRTTVCEMPATGSASGSDSDTPSHWQAASGTDGLGLAGASGLA